MIVDISKDVERKIIEIEERVLNKYRFVLERYASIFLGFGAILKTQLSWKNVKSNIIYEERPAILVGYTSYVVCEVRDANGRIIESLDHDMYMDFAWVVASYQDKAGNGIIAVDDDVDDDDVFSTMESCLAYFNDPY